MLHAADTVERFHVDAHQVITNIDQFMLVLEDECGGKLCCAYKSRIRSILPFLAMGPHFDCYRGRGKGWLDPMILIIRGTLARAGTSVSLSFTDVEQTRIDRPFARCLRALWDVLPGRARTRSPDALVYRARKLRTVGSSRARKLHTVAAPDPHVLRAMSQLFQDIEEAGREMLELVGDDPHRSADAVRQVAKAVAKSAPRLEKWPKVPNRF